MGRPRQFSSKRREKFPWLVLIGLLVTIYLFWILPAQIGPRKVNVEFAQSK